MNIKIALICIFCFYYFPVFPQLKNYAFKIEGGATLTNGNLDLVAPMIGLGAEYYHSIKSSFGLMWTLDLYTLEKEINNLSAKESWYKELFVAAGQMTFEPFYSYKFRSEKDQSHFYITLGAGMYQPFAKTTVSEGEYEFLGDFEKEGEFQVTQWSRFPYTTKIKENFSFAWKPNFSLQVGYDIVLPGSGEILGLFIKYHSFDDIKPLSYISREPAYEDFYFDKNNTVLPIKLGITFKLTGKDKTTRRREKKTKEYHMLNNQEYNYGI